MRNPTCVSSYYYMCVRMLVYVCEQKSGEVPSTPAAAETPADERTAASAAKPKKETESEEEEEEEAAKHASKGKETGSEVETEDETEAEEEEEEKPKAEPVKKAAAAAEDRRAKTVAEGENKGDKDKAAEKAKKLVDEKAMRLLEEKAKLEAVLKEKQEKKKEKAGSAAATPAAAKKGAGKEAGSGAAAKKVELAFSGGKWHDDVKVLLGQLEKAGKLKEATLDEGDSRFVLICP